MAHRALPGPGVYRFGFSRKAGALTRKRKATQRAAFPQNLAPALMSLPSVALSSVASKSTFMVTLCPPLVNIQRRGDTAQSRRRRCSISAESVLNSAGFGALAGRYTQRLLRQRPHSGRTACTLLQKAPRLGPLSEGTGWPQDRLRTLTVGTLSCNPHRDDFS